MSYIRSAVFVVLGLVTGTVVGLSIVRVVRLVPVEEKAGPPTLSVWHERTSTIHSMCDECAQPGDLIKAHMRGSSSAVRGISVYRDEQHVKGCFGCDDFSMTADLLGRYVVVGFQMDRTAGCAQPRGDYDGDVVALERCGACLVTSEVVVR